MGTSDVIKYGFVHCALEDLVLKLFGEEKWMQILDRSRILGEEGGSFLIHRNYSDEETLHLIAASSEVLGLELSACLEAFGEHFLKYCQEAGYDRLLRVLGGSLEDFLTNLDSLHDHLGSIYPGMNAPSFRCTHGSDSSLLLHYYSERKGLQAIVKGLVKIISEEFFHTKVTIEETTADKDDDDEDHVVLKIIEITSNPSNKGRETLDHLTTRTNLESQDPRDLCMSVGTFCEAFPFHIVFDYSFRITQMGMSLQRLLRPLQQTKVILFTDLFRIIRPMLDCTYEAIVNHQNMSFVVQTLPGIIVHQQKHQILKLKGQMLSVPESDSILFLCSPRVMNLDEMLELGLYLSDFQVHDSTRDLVLMKNAHRGERELMQKLEETTNQLKIADAQLLADKKRTDELLHSILPSKVAEKLRLNLPVPAEKFEMVSVLFSDIVGFTAMCSHEKVVPMDIVHMLNKLYTLFDRLSNIHSVYKVETIGDAYMVVGGIPEFVSTHADQVVAMGLNMVAVVQKVLSPADDNPIKIRVGIHSGSVLAGVVGWKMPRYCLFGNTVAISNKLEGSSQASRVNISEETKSHLTKTGYSFEENPSQTLFPFKCYFVTRADLEYPDLKMLDKREQVHKKNRTPSSSSPFPNGFIDRVQTENSLKPSTKVHQVANSFEKISLEDITTSLSAIPKECPLSDFHNSRVYNGERVIGDQLLSAEKLKMTSSKVNPEPVHPGASTQSGSNLSSPRSSLVPQGKGHANRMSTKCFMPLIGFAICSSYCQEFPKNAAQFTQDPRTISAKQNLKIVSNKKESTVETEVNKSSKNRVTCSTYKIDNSHPARKKAPVRDLFCGSVVPKEKTSKNIDKTTPVSHSIKRKSLTEQEANISSDKLNRRRSETKRENDKTIPEKQDGRRPSKKAPWRY